MSVLNNLSFENDIDASKYIFKTIYNQEYMFMKCKIGNCVYGEQDPEY